MAGLLVELVEWLASSWVVTIFLALTILLIYHAPGGRPKNFPPGVLILPVIGSLHLIPMGPTREFLQGLKKKYGNMASFGMFNARFVVVSGASTLKEVLTQKVTAARPEMMPTAGRNYMTTNGRTANLGLIGAWGDQFQEQRRFLLHHLRDLGFGKTSYEPIMLQEIAEMLDYISKQGGQPITMKRLFSRSVINVLWGMMMGKRYPYGHAKLNKILETFLQPAEYHILSPVWFLPDICRYVRYIPILRRDLLVVKKILDYMEDEVKECIASDDFDTNMSVVATFVREIKKRKNTDSIYTMEQLTALLWDMFVAGMETTSSTLSMGVKLLAENPDVAKKMQNELDTVLGKGTKPSFSDIERLPYTQATIYEIQRVFNLARFSLPHYVTEDSVLCGYNIPKGTILLPNYDNLMTDPTQWEYPNTFDPRNFLDESGKMKKIESFLPFGVGKRLCTGEALARRELFLFITCLAQRFTTKIVEETDPGIINPVFGTAPEYVATFQERL